MELRHRLLDQVEEALDLANHHEAVPKAAAVTKDLGEDGLWLLPELIHAVHGSAARDPERRAWLDPPLLRIVGIWNDAQENDTSRVCRDGPEAAVHVADQSPVVREVMIRREDHD